MSSTRSRGRTAKSRAETLNSHEIATRASPEANSQLEERYGNAGKHSAGRAPVTHVTEASGNVFADLGFGPEEAANLKVRSRLMMQLEDYITEEGMTQVEAAAFFGTAQPRISDLVRGKIGRFSIDALVNMLATAGLSVEVSVKAAKPA